MFVISDGGDYDYFPRYWAMDQGWGDLTDATVFREEERETYDLPEGNRFGSEWVQLPKY